MPGEDALNIGLLNQVLEPYPEPTSRSGNFISKPLSFYSTELKQLNHALSLIAAIYEARWAGDHSQHRYFNTLRNLLLVTGTADVPTPTERLGKRFYEEYQALGSTELTPEQRAELDKAILAEAAHLLSSGGAESIPAITRQAIRNVQDLFDVLTPEQFDRIISEDELAWKLQAVNVQGTEAARFFRLPSDLQATFFSEVDKILRGQLPAGAPTNIRAYREAAGKLQKDVRFRVQALLRGYRELRAELGDEFPLMTTDLRPLRQTEAPRPQALVKPASHALHPLQLIVSGCPGSGKSHWIDEKMLAAGAHIYRIQFHAETGYSEFVGAYKPTTLYEGSSGKIFDAAGNEVTQRRPLIDYTFVPGPLAAALVEAFDDPNQVVAVIIEEINRGNAAAAFGELFQALDRTNSGISRYAVTPSPDLATYLARHGALRDGKVVFPPNLYIWASMNGADQNVHPIDTAFRRRWGYLYLGFSEPCNYQDSERRIIYGGRDYDWDEFRNALNKRLLALDVQEDKLIGPYFLTPAQLRDPNDVLYKLFLYLWEDVLRFAHDELFSKDSFAEVAAQWNGGNGEPLRIDLPRDDIAVPLDGDLSEPEASAPSPAEVGDDSE